MELMFSNRALEKLSKHVALELGASLTYLYFSHVCRKKNLDGYADLFAEWSREEHGHAEMILNYLGEVGFPASYFLETRYGGTEDEKLERMLEVAVELEKTVGKSIYEVNREATADGDFGLVEFMLKLSKLVPKEINEKETHLQRVKELGEVLADDLLNEFLEKFSEDKGD
jgi:ferritin